jgi:hypothetical protein
LKGEGWTEQKGRKANERKRWRVGREGLFEEGQE